MHIFSEQNVIIVWNNIVEPLMTLSTLFVLLIFFIWQTFCKYLMWLITKLMTFTQTKDSIGVAVFWIAIKYHYWKVYFKPHVSQFDRNIQAIQSISQLVQLCRFLYPKETTEYIVTRDKYFMKHHIIFDLANEIQRDLKQFTWTETDIFSTGIYTINTKPHLKFIIYVSDKRNDPYFSSAQSYFQSRDYICLDDIYCQRYDISEYSKIIHDIQVNIEIQYEEKHDQIDFLSAIKLQPIDHKFELSYIHYLLADTDVVHDFLCLMYYSVLALSNINTDEFGSLKYFKYFF